MLKKKTVKSAMPIYCAAALWLIASLFLKMYRLPGLLVAAVLAAAGYLIGSRLFPGRVVEYEEKASSGDAEVDRQIEEGRKALTELRQANADIESPVISAKLDRMERAARQIFDRIEKEPRKALRVRKFMNYYLPTCVKLLGHYRDLDASGVSGENIAKSKACIEDSLEMIASAFEKQLDNLFSDQALDISTDIQVLETMMAGEGLTDAGQMNDSDSNEKSEPAAQTRR